MLDRGQIVREGDPEVVVSGYLSGGYKDIESSWQHPIGLGSLDVLLKRISVSSFAGSCTSNAFFSKHDIAVDLELYLRRLRAGLCVGFDLLTERGATVLRSYNTDEHPDRWVKLQTGKNVLRCVIPGGLLNGGRYFLAPRVGIHNQEWILNSDPIVSFTVTLSHGESPFWNVLNEGNRPGTVAPILSWSSFGRSDLAR
jgi:hypothetical protein